jgi:lipoprotein-anchoring transpeptidase ErfK/SrfK
MCSITQANSAAMISESTNAHRWRGGRKQTNIVLAALGFATIAALAAAPQRQTVDSSVVDSGAIAADGPLTLHADLSARTLYMRVGDEVVGSYPVAIGLDSKPTPTGSFHIRKIVWNPAWVPPDEKWAKGKTAQAPGAKANPMKLVKIFFLEPDYYIHGTSESESLGDRASHGCLRMDPDDAYRVARYVMAHGGSPRSENWFWRVLHFRSETKTVYLDHPIPLTITH